MSQGSPVLLSGQIVGVNQRMLPRIIGGQLEPALGGCPHGAHMDLVSLQSGRLSAMVNDLVMVNDVMM